MASDNLHLQRAKARLEGIPKRALDQGWETNDPLLNETMTAVAHALIAQAEIGQATLVAVEQISHRVTGINAQVLRHEYKVPHENIQKWAKYYVEQEMIRHKSDEQPPDYGWFSQLFGGKK